MWVPRVERPTTNSGSYVRWYPRCSLVPPGSRCPFQHAWTIATHCYTGSATTCTDACSKPFKMPQHASSPTREGASTSRPSCSSYIGFKSANVWNSRSPCWCTRHFTTSCLCIWRKSVNLCHTLGQFWELSKRIYLVTDSCFSSNCSAEWQCDSCTMYKLTYLTNLLIVWQ